MNRRGFSLLELLVAMSLSVLLLAGIYSGLDMFWRYSTTGHEEVERAQIARAVLRQIELDLRSVVYKDTSSDAAGSSGSMGGAAASASGGAGGGGSTPSNTTVFSAGSSGSTGGTAAGGGSGGIPSTPTTPTTPTTGGTTSSGGSGGNSTGGSGAGSSSSQSTVAPAGLAGDATTIKLTTCSPSRRTEYVPFGTQVAGVSRSSDMLTVGYQLGDGTAPAGSAQATGLARMEGDRMQIAQAEAQGNRQLLLSSLRMVAQEVTSLTFAYYDGYNWRSDWDSSSLGGLPTAVEVIVEVTTPARGSRPGSPAASRGSKTQAFRLVVAIPLAKATDTFSTTTP